MKFSFILNYENEKEFFDHWESKYSDSNEPVYLENINKPLTEESIQLLFEWKNGGKIALKKLQSIRKNYPLVFSGDVKERYLNPNQSGGPIWNIFYIHLLSHSVWPIFDQHVYRSMVYIKKQVIEEIPTNKADIFTLYLKEYIPFVKAFNEKSHRRIDKALYSYGQFLKKVKRIT